MSFAAPFLLSVGVLMAEVTMLIMVVALIHVIIETIFLTISVISTETLIIISGIHNQQVFFIMKSINWEAEDLIWTHRIRTLSLPCSLHNGRNHGLS